MEVWMNFVPWSAGHKVQLHGFTKKLEETTVRLDTYWVPSAFECLKILNLDTELLLK